VIAFYQSLFANTIFNFMAMVELPINP